MREAVVLQALLQLAFQDQAVRFSQVLVRLRVHDIRVCKAGV